MNGGSSNFWHPWANDSERKLEIIAKWPERMRVLDIACLFALRNVKFVSWYQMQVHDAVEHQCCNRTRMVLACNPFHDRTFSMIALFRGVVQTIALLAGDCDYNMLLPWARG